MHSLSNSVHRQGELCPMNAVFILFIYFFLYSVTYGVESEKQDTIKTDCDRLKPETC